MKKNADQLMKRCEEQRARFYASFDRNEGKILDDRFALPDDAPLTEDEIKAIDAYWGKYSFAYPKIDYKSFQTYKNRYGKLDVRHCPGNVEYNFFFKRFEKSIMVFLYEISPEVRSIQRMMEHIIIFVVVIKELCIVIFTRIVYSYSICSF